MAFPEQGQTAEKIENIFSRCKGSSLFRIEKAEEHANRIGANVRLDIGHLMNDLKIHKIKLPGSLDIQQEEKLTLVSVIRYLPKKNQLILVWKTDPISLGGKPKERVVKELENKEWLKYGPKVISALLEEATQNIQEKKE
jgi:hypothetical protein